MGLALLYALGRPLSLLSALGKTAPPGTVSTVRSVLVMESWQIGDIVLATPFLAELRELFPGARISLLGQAHATAVLAGTNLVDEVIQLDLPWTFRSRGYTLRGYGWRRLGRTIMNLRSRRFDVAFESRMDPRAKAVLALSGARRRVGYGYGGGDWLLTDVVPAQDLGRHRTEDWLGLLGPFGGATGVPLPRLHVSPDEARAVRERLAQHGVTDADYLVAVHPGASHESKRWPLDRFAAVIAEVTARLPTRVITIVAPDGYGAQLAELPGVVSVSGSLRELIALVAACDVLLCNDSGPMHLAAAVGTPIVGIFHSHAAKEFAPLGPGHHVLAPSPRSAVATHPGTPPPGRLLLDVTVPVVVDAVLDALGSRPGR